MACAHKDRGRDVSKPVVVQQEGCYLTHGGLSHPHGWLPTRVAKVLADRTLGVVGGKGLLIAGLDDRCLAPLLVEAEVCAPHALGDDFRVLAGLEASYNGFEKTLCSKAWVSSAADLDLAGLVRQCRDGRRHR